MEIAPLGGQRVALADGLHALRHDQGAELAAHRHEGADDDAVGGARVEASHERHVELDDLGLEEREGRQAGVAGAQVVHGDAEAHRAQTTHARLGVAHVVERRALGNLEDDSARDLRPGRGVREELLVQQVPRVEVHEQTHVGRGAQHRPRGLGAHRTPEVVHPPEALGGVEDRAGVGEGGLSRS